MCDDLTTSLAPETVISRREIEPLLSKAQDLMNWYEEAAGCGASVQNTNGSLVDIQGGKDPFAFCKLCRSCFVGDSKGEEDECPCAQMHREAQFKVERGATYIYSCKAGFSYWTSPFYAGLRYAGSLVAGQVLAVSREKAVDLIHSLCGISKEEIACLLSDVPEKTHEEIQAMAELLTVCAEKLSLSTRKYAAAISKKNSGKKAVDKTGSPEKWDENRAYFQEKERMLLAALRRGDMDAVHRSLHDLLEIVQKSGTSDFDAVRFRLTQLATFLSRSAGNINNSESHDRCFRRIQEASTTDELRENLKLYIEHMGTEVFSFRGLRHACALRKAERFIWENYTRKISLSEIASASGLSAPYFSSVFKEERGINLSSYLNKLRVEKAAGLLEETGFSLAHIAEACGFDDQNWFSKIFKSRMGMSPGKFRELGNKTN